MPENLPLTLTLPNDLSLLPVARQYVEAVCESGGLDPQTTHAIVLATHEALSNVIRHAHKNQPEASVHIQCLLLPDGIEVRLIDQGEPFDISCVPHLDPTEPREGGRGVFLMRTVLDEIHCSRHENGGNSLRMVKRVRRRIDAAECREK